MATNVRWVEKFLELSPGEVRPQEPLGPLTSARVGGPAEIFVRPSSAEALSKVLSTAKAEGVPVTVLGGGANTLVGDKGIPGVTLKLPSSFFPESIDLNDDGGLVTLGAGAAIARLIVLMKTHRLVGAEFLAGIPGTIGGACRMNAGTKMGECMSVVDAIEVATPDGTGWLSRSSVPFRYRHTELPAGGVVTRVRFRLPFGDLKDSLQKMEADLAYRKRTQPLAWPNFGSVFKNPPNDFAGRLIETVGLKGHVVGKAQISTLHANWIVNTGGATAQDMVSLMALAIKKVYDAHGVELQPEVQRVGVFV